VTLGLQVPIQDLPPDEAAGLLASLAKHYYRARDLVRSEELLTQAIRVAEDSGLRNSDYLRGLNGLGAVACARGNYEAGLEHSMRLLAASEAAGHEGYASAATGNIALCLLRVGRYTDAMVWSKRMGSSTGLGINAHLNRLEIEALASAASGERGRARVVGPEAHMIAMSSDVPWIVRRAHLVAADSFHLAGESRKAKESGKAAIILGSPLRDDPAITGRFFRWLRRTYATTLEGYNTVVPALRAALDTQIDALDTVEVLGALMSMGLLTLEERQNLETRLIALPAAVAQQLDLLGAFRYEGENRGEPDLSGEIGSANVVLAATPPQEEAVV